MRLPRRFRPKLDYPVTRPTFETARLIVRPYRITDLVDFAWMQRDADTVELMPWPVRTIPESLDHLKVRLGRDRLERIGDFMALAVSERDTRRYLGDISVTHRPASGDPFPLAHYSLGWVTVPWRRQEGFAEEAARGLLDLLADRDTPIFSAAIDSRNGASQALAVKLGLRYHVTSSEEVKGERVQLRHYAMMNAATR